jgi:hypothetical protein
MREELRRAFHDKLHVGPVVFVHGRVVSDPDHLGVANGVSDIRGEA